MFSIEDVYHNKTPIIIAGGRDFNDIRKMSLTIKTFCRERNLKSTDIQIVSGGAKGADSLGEYFAKFHNIEIKQFLPDWKRYSKLAGFQRNEQMAQYVSSMNGGCIVFWDGVSNGSKHMIKMAKEYNLDYKVVNYGTSVVNQ